MTSDDHTGAPPAPPRGAAWLLRGGRTLPREQWAAHHALVLRVLVALLVAVSGYALVVDRDPVRALLHVAPLVVLIAVAAAPRLSRSVRALAGASALMAVAAVAVHVSGGRTEAHFLFFALLPLAALYAMPAPFLLAAGLVLVHHVLVGSWVHGAVFEHGTHVLPMALLHAGFVLLEGWACFVAWRRFEDRRELVETLVTQRTAQLRAQAAELARLAHTDALTGLANRTVLERRLADAVGSPAAVLLLDLDDFKVVNDVYGHCAGDAVLVEVARRLEGCARPSDTVARLGGDEFVLLLDGVGTAEEAGAVTCRLLSALRAPVRWDAETFSVGCSVGITFTGPDDARGPEELLRDADIAMYRAKAAGRDEHRVFEPAMHAAVVSHSQLVRDLRTALERDELWVAYQPQVDLVTGRVVGVEALVRWDHPVRGPVGPDVFVPVAEHAGLIDAIDQWVLRQACRQLVVWDRAGLPPLRMAVNVSAQRLARGGLAETIATIAAATGADPGRLEIEVTETTAVTSGGDAAATLAEVRALGVHVAIDDFGTGHSSLGRLHALPLDRLKIDRCFVTPLQDGDPCSSIAAGVLALGRGLGLDVVAEGVETEEQRDALVALGCTTGQGWLFGRPVRPAAIEALVRAATPAPTG